MNKFKVGDKVKVISLGSTSKGYGVNPGMVGEVVVEYDSFCGCVGVKFDHRIDGHALDYAGKYVLEPDAINGLWIEPEYLKLIEEEKQMEPQVKNMKIRIKDKEHSRLVQETLFEMGYGWPDQAVHHTSVPWLTAYDSGRIYYSTKVADFDSHENEEVELIATYAFKPVDQEAKRKATEKEALQKDVAEMQKQLEEMKQKLEKM